MIKTKNIKHLAQVIKSADMSCESLIQDCLNKVDDSYNAFIYLDKEGALAQAKQLDQAIKEGQVVGPLAGIPFVVKDNIHVKGFASTAGTPALKHFYPQEDQPLVATLKEAGAIIIGKTNMHELAFGVTGYNLAFYDQVSGNIGVRSSVNKNQCAGGSSSGSGTALGLGICSFALGTDTGGSARIPAAINNSVGFRPSLSKYSKGSIAPISPTRDTIGFMGHNVSDIVFLNNLITKENPVQVSSIKLGVDESQVLQNASEKIVLLWTKLKEKLSAQGNIELININLQKVYELNQMISLPVALFEANFSMQEYLAEHCSKVDLKSLVSKIASPDVKSLYSDLVLPKKLPAPDGSLVDAEPIYNEAINNFRPQLIEAYSKIFGQVDATIAPTLVSEALEATPDASTLENFSLFIQNTDPISNAGFASISIPALHEKDTQLSLLIDGKDDQKVLAIAACVEQALNKN